MRDFHQSWINRQCEARERLGLGKDCTMRYGCCTNMLVNYPGGPGGIGIDYLEKIAELGFDYVELTIGHMTALSESDFEKLARRVENSGICCEAVNNFFPIDKRLTGPNVDIAAIDAYVSAALNRAHRLGVEYVVFGSGPAKYVPDGFPKAKAYQQICEFLQRADVIAQQAGLTILIEPLRQQECNIINTYAEGCQLAKDVNRPNIKVLVDYYHLATEREPAQDIVAGREYLRHAHYASIHRRSFPTGLDDELNRDFFQALKTIGYNDRISLESYIDQDFEQEASAGLRFLKEQVAAAKPFS